MRDVWARMYKRRTLSVSNVRAVILLRLAMEASSSGMRGWWVSGELRWEDSVGKVAYRLKLRHRRLIDRLVRSPSHF